jgi:mono/diheme cytochrome c family protein
MQSTRDLYRHSCQRCHGADGTGTPQRQRTPAIPNFTQKRWQARRNDSQLLVSILDGKGSHMPAFSGRISAEQARDLIRSIRAFAPPPTKPAAHPLDDFETAFRKLQAEYDDLERQIRDLSRPKPPGKPAKGQKRE